jgi:hypothetical protein
MTGRRWRAREPFAPGSAGRESEPPRELVIHPLDVRWPQEATGTFLMVCHSSNGHQFLVQWRSRDLDSAAREFAEWAGRDWVSVDKVFWPSQSPGMPHPARVLSRPGEFIHGFYPLLMEDWVRVFHGL